MTPESFAKVFVELRRADAESDSVQQFDARKQEILDRNGVTPDELREFVREYSQHAQQMADLWDTIEARLRNPPRDSVTRDTLPAPSTGRRPPVLPRRDTLRRPEPSRRPDTLRRPGAPRGPGRLRPPDTFRRPGAPPPTLHR